MAYALQSVHPAVQALGVVRYGDNYHRLRFFCSCPKSPAYDSGRWRGCSELLVSSEVVFRTGGEPGTHGEPAALAMLCRGGTNPGAIEHRAVGQVLVPETKLSPISELTSAEVGQPEPLLYLEDDLIGQACDVNDDCVGRFFEVGELAGEHLCLHVMTLPMR